VMGLGVFGSVMGIKFPTASEKRFSHVFYSLFSALKIKVLKVYTEMARALLTLIPSRSEKRSLFVTQCNEVKRDRAC